MTRAIGRSVTIAAFGIVTACGNEPDTSPSPTPTARTTPAAFTVRGRWPQENANPRPTLRYRVENRGLPFDEAAVNAAIGRAADRWNTTGLVTFAATTAKDADLLISWHTGHHGACQPFGVGSDVAHSGPVAPGTFIHFDGDRDWTAESVFATALHELGHVLGLGHSAADDAVMSTAADRPTELSPHDLAGLASLYGPNEHASAAAGDLVIDGGPVLRGIAPAATCDFAALDADGDGADDLLVWRTDAAGHGALTIYRFDSGLRLAGTRGPFLGVIATGSTVRLAVGPTGARYLASIVGDRELLREFDRHGIPGTPRTPPPPGLLQAGEPVATGDFNGDGAAELVRRPH